MRWLTPLLILITYLSHGQRLQLPALFSDHMVLQRGIRPPIWGKADPFAPVVIQSGTTKVHTAADSRGNWFTHLPALQVHQTHTITVVSGKTKLVLTDVVAGDVFFAGGQSNMQYTLDQDSEGERVYTAAPSSIRFFTVPRDIAYRPRFDVNKKAKEAEQEGRWQPGNPERAKRFSAVAYHFAKRISDSTHLPVGIIEATWGGTPIEAHMSMEACRALPYHAAALSSIFERSSTDSLVIDKAKATPQLPTTLFNAMINPIIPYGISGIIWYQGEHNWNNPFRYREQFISFITDLRIRWRQGYLPFYFVQLPNMGKVPSNPNVEDFWSVLRESQAAALALPNTGMVVGAALGDGDLHPKSKRLFGAQLAALALREIFRYDVAASGPQLVATSFMRDTVELSFKLFNGGLQFRNNSIPSFAIAGADHKFYWAEAVVRGNRILVYSRQVPAPQALRYGWGENPKLGIFDEAGFAAAPFRTDTWPLREDGRW